MNKIIRWVGVGATAALAACSLPLDLGLPDAALPSDVSDVKAIIGSKATGGTPFTKALFQEYQDYTKSQITTEVEWVDASDTARKGLRAGAGEVVVPDELGSRAIPPARIPELTAARGRLMGYFNGGATERVPSASAKAQVAFDCWLEQEAEGIANGPCRTAFLAHEPMLKKTAPVTAVAQESRRQFTITFALGSAQLTAPSMQILKDVAAARAQLGAPVVWVAGFTDTLGSADANARLSRQRADAVTAELVKLGINPGMISEDALGESKLAVATKDGVAEAKNRRVEISLSGAAWSHGGYGGYAYGDRGRGGYGYGGWGHGFAIFFNSGSSRLSAQDVERLKQVVAAQKNMSAKAVRVIGFTDLTGSATTNARLARERAQAVAAEINKLGGTATAVDARPGESWGARNDGRARRVEILFDY
ncbi:OmpA family protein [Paramagnetospirillum kuznetsovii]|uniref:OmpA family protein n=1 Tax=Paramagnetospirillum kuznetsovii TaxID=2053833 RepID=A0A364NTW1_9PROT|nr:OmpA family protein [Paramagnetospirillum kuznetsovii]RAU20521.1 OmpA family protein [Paramagnetospirillum kuznetsovii]